MQWTTSACASAFSTILLLGLLCQALPSGERRSGAMSRGVRSAESQTGSSGTGTMNTSPTTSSSSTDPNEERWSCTLASRSQIYEGLSPSHRPVYSEETWCQDHLHDYMASGSTEVPTQPGWDGIRHSKMTTCRGNQLCLPIVSVRREFNLYTGVVSSTRPHRCGCFSTSEPCRAVRHTHHFFPNTPYSRRVDVRRCMGTCGNGQGTCKAVKNHTVTIPGPNGAVCVNVTDECECQRGCFRSSYNMVFNEQVTDANTGEKTERAKIIDVGKCSGACKEQVREDCLKSIANTTGPLQHLTRLLCDSDAEKSNHSCVPDAVSTVNYTDTKGVEQSVPVIESCTCRNLDSGLSDFIHL